MDTLQNMRVFMRVVDAGSFTAAAQQMELTTAHVSRAVADLERHLRTRLLNRTTRRIALTEAGERYLINAANNHVVCDRKPRPRPATPMCDRPAACACMP